MLDLKSFLMEQKFFESLEEVNEFLAENEVSDSTIIQTLIFDKSVHETQAEAIEWATTHGFNASGLVETEETFVIRQLEESEFLPDSFRVIELRRGVDAMIGILKPLQAESPLTLSLRLDDTIKLSDEVPHIIELAKVVSGFHPRYGKVEITKDTLRAFSDNFRNNAVGVDIAINFDHEGREAAAWIKEVFLSPDETTLLGVVKWTPKGALSLSGLEFRYFSPEYTNNFTHEHSGAKFGPTLTGGALVNSPFLKLDAIVGLSTKEGNKMANETIALSDHNLKVLGLEKTISDFKLSTEVAVGTIKNLGADVTKLSAEVKTLKSASEKKERETANRKLFDDGKINKAMLDAMNAGKSTVEVLALSTKMKIEPEGEDGEVTESVALSAGEKKMAKSLGMKEEDFAKYSKDEV